MRKKQKIKSKLLDMFIVSLTIIYIYYNNNYETETQNKK